MGTVLASRSLTPNSEAAAIRVPSFIVIGGGEAGAFYVQQLLRAAGASRLSTSRIVVVDRDASCLAAKSTDPRVRVDALDWSAWLDAHLDEAGPDDHLVPYHWAPHLLLTWLEHQVARAGGRTTRRTPGPGGFPYEAVTGAGDRALSYATWPCPPACIEPALCPHTRGAKDWSLAGDLARAVKGVGAEEPIVFRCLHLVYGVGTIPVTEILAARARVIAGIRGGERSYLVATSSHCHALATVLEVSPDAGKGRSETISTARPGGTPPIP